MFVLGVSLAVLIGVSLGMLGGGGSILTVPILLYVFRLPPEQAISSSLLVAGVDAQHAAQWDDGGHGVSLKYQRTEWKNTGAAKASGAMRSSRPTAPVTEDWLPQ